MDSANNNLKFWFRFEEIYRNLAGGDQIFFEGNRKSAIFEKKRSSDRDKVPEDQGDEPEALGNNPVQRSSVRGSQIGSSVPVSIQPSSIEPETESLGDVKASVLFPSPLVNQLVSPVLGFKKRESSENHIWKYESRRVDGVSGGFIYRYKLNSTCDDITPSQNRIKSRSADDEMESKSAHLFPALEPCPWSILFLDPRITKDELMKARLICTEEGERKVDYDLENRDFLNDLGYCCVRDSDGVYFEFPDSKSLQIRWHEMTQKSISIVSADGISDHSDFIEAYMNHDLLLSDPQKFVVEGYDPNQGNDNDEAVHDHYNHALKVLLIMTNEKDYKEFQKTFRSVIKECRQRISDLRSSLVQGKLTLSAEDSKNLNFYINRMELILSAALDTMVSPNRAESWKGDLMTSDYVKKSMRDLDLSVHPRWRLYFEKEFQKNPELYGDQATFSKENFENIKKLFQKAFGNL
jgi:hypothetical protein